MLIGRCRDRTAERPERRKDRDDATMEGPDDPYDAETSAKAKDWMVKGLALQGLDGLWMES